MIPRLHAIPGKAQHVADTHGRAAENVALDRDAILVPAGDLHDRRITDPRQQCAHSQARHMAVRAAAVGGIDGIDITVEHPRTFVDFLRIRRIRRRKLGGDGKFAGAQHPFEAPRRGVSRQDGQRIAGNRLVFESHA